MSLHKIDIMALFASKWFWLLALIAPFYETMFSLLTLVVLDFVSGVWKVYKTKGAKHITSIGMRKSVSKVFGYFLFIIAGVIAEDMVPGNIPFMRIVIGLIGMAELKSISENIGEVLGMNLWKYIRKVFDKNTGLTEDREKEKEQ